MPYSHSIDTSRAVVLATAEGRLCDDDLIRLAHEISEDPLFLPGMRLLCDWSGVTQCDVTRVGIAYELANSRFDPSSRRAYVVRHGPETQVVAYILACSSPEEALNIRLFHTRAEALAWLNEGLPEKLRIG